MARRAWVIVTALLASFLIRSQNVFAWKVVSVSVDRATLIANGVSTAKVTALVLDEAGRPVPSAAVRLSVSPALGTLTPTIATTGPTGIVTSTFKTLKTEGSATIKADVNVPIVGSTISGSAVMTLVKIKIDGLTFTGPTMRNVRLDSGFDPGPYHWFDNNKDGDALDVGDTLFPVAYVRNSMVQVRTHIQIQPPIPSSTPVRIRGNGPGLIDFDGTGSAVGSSVSVPSSGGLSARGLLPKVVYWYNPGMTIAWSISLDNGVTWTPIGNTTNRVYVTLAAPINAPSLLYETFLHIGCRNAINATTPAAVVAAVWNDFKVPIPGVKRADGVSMQYWAEDGSDMVKIGRNCQPVTAMIYPRSPADFLNGVGTCVAWSQLFNEVLRAQGVTDTHIVEVRANGTVNPGSIGFLVKNWNFGTHLRSGVNGICQSVKAGDDVQVIPVAKGKPNEVCITSGINARCNTLKSGDDLQVAPVGQQTTDCINSGQDGICQTTRADDDLQVIGVGRGSPNQVCVSSGKNGLLSAIKAGDDTIQAGMVIGDRYPYKLYLGDLTDPGGGYGSIDGDCANQPGIAGQDTVEPPEFFQNHFIVRYGTQLYDPSYGAGPFSSEIAHENAAIHGISTGTRAKKNAVEQELKYLQLPDPQ